ncbi:hypothetical protein LSPH24S_06645 [Lysinibacillus sphaericus]
MLVKAMKIIKLSKIRNISTYSDAEIAIKAGQLKNVINLQWNLANTSDNIMLIFIDSFMENLLAVV